MQKIRAFPAKIEFQHLWWLAEVLDLGMSDGGIDLGDHKLGVEMKCRYQKYQNSNYAVHAYQVDEFKNQNPNKELFWGFVLYGLSEEPKKIPKDADLDKFITHRSAWFFPWDWVRQFPIANPRTGPYRYVSSKAIRASGPFTEHTKGGGKLYLPKGCEALEQRLL